MLNYFVPLLDDYLRGILPNDLVLIGAPTGAGKTDLAMNIAASNADAGRWVHYFALEAEKRELERRAKYSLLVRKLYEHKHPQRESMNYTDWLIGKCEPICGDFNRDVDQQILERLSRLRTYYRDVKFTAEDLQHDILEVYQDSSLIVIDHLHYIDLDSDENENKALGETVKTIRDVSLRIGVPIILVAHLRKRDFRMKQLVATLDDFHGSSNVVKIATQVITIERATGLESDKWWKSPTYMSILKDRRSGVPGLVALCDFDRRTKAYSGRYTLGRVSGDEWSEIARNETPTWALHHEPRQPLPPPMDTRVR